MATPQAALTSQIPVPSRPTPAKESRRLDLFLVLGMAIALGAAIAGIRASGASLRYFLQPTGAVIVLGGTLGIILMTTPRRSLLDVLRRVAGLLRSAEVDRKRLIDEIIEHARTARRGGMLALEARLGGTQHAFLRQALQLALDVDNRAELQALLETELRMAERQGEADAKALEVAGGFAPTLGILGTVVGLIDVLRQFSNLQAVGYGIGTAFVSTIYGLGLANLLLLPAAHRIRARVAENFETQELVVEGVLAIADGVHPALIRMRLDMFLRGRAQTRGA